MARSYTSVLKFVQDLYSSTKKVLVASLSKNLISYFAWMGIFYLICGVFSLIEQPAIRNFLCTIPGAMNATAKQEVGCGNCTSNLMLCPKSQCWRLAFNYTFQTRMKTADMPYRAALLDAKDDAICNDLVQLATDPVSVVTNVINLRTAPASTATTAVTVPTKPCLVIQCLVLNTALTSPDLTDGSTNLPGTCTNKLLMKEPYDATKCPCNNLFLPSDQVSTISSQCSPEIRELQTKLFRRVLASKSNCLKQSIEAQNTTASRSSYNTMAETQICRSAVQTATFVTNMFSFPASTTETPSPSCGPLCGAFKTAMTLSACNWASVTKDDLNQVVLFCGTSDTSLSSANKIVNSLCAQQNIPSLCSTASAPTIRRLVPNDTGIEGLRQNDTVCTGNSKHRHLQTATTAPSLELNNQRDDYVVSDWSKCTCYQQCIPGVRTRSVRCSGGGSCKLPVPSSTKDCSCEHCADCKWVLIVIMVQYILFFFQALCSLILWLAFWSVSYLDEDDLCDMGICTKLTGCACKSLPFIVRLLTHCTFFTVMFLLLVTFQPSEFQSDCKQSDNLRQLVIVVTSVWIIQLMFGLYMKSTNAMVPWLYNATSEGAWKLITSTIRAIGP